MQRFSLLVPSISYLWGLRMPLVTHFIATNKNDTILMPYPFKKELSKMNFSQYFSVVIQGKSNKITNVLAKLANSSTVTPEHLRMIESIFDTHRLSIPRDADQLILLLVAFYMPNKP